MLEIALFSVICFVLGYALGALHRKAKTPRPPAPPRCRAALTSGEQCIYQKGHDGYHKVTWKIRQRYDSPEQSFCWEDPNAGLHPTEIRWSE